MYSTKCWHDMLSDRVTSDKHKICIARKKKKIGHLYIFSWDDILIISADDGNICSGNGWCDYWLGGLSLQHCFILDF